MTDTAIYTALANQRKIWLAGLDVGAKLIFKTSVAKVVRVERVTKTQLVLGNGMRVSRKTGAVIGEESKEVKQLRTCWPYFDAGTDFDAGYMLRPDQERYSAECVREMVVAGMANES